MTEIFKNNQIPDKTWQEIVQPSLGGTENEGVSTSGGGQQYYYPEIYGGIFYGSSFKTNDSGARLEIFPQYDPTIGMIVYDNADVEVFKIIIDGINVGDVIMGNYTGGQGAMWDKSAGTFSVAGAFTAGSIAIGTSPNWFKVDTSGNIWSGNATLAGAQTNTFAVLNTGILYCKAANINGSVIDGTSTIGGRVSSTLASAIDASGHFADAAINTATSTILGAFTFGVSGALQIGTYVNGVSGDIRISPTGILGRDKDNNTTFSINATTGIAVLNGLVVGTNVGLGTAQDSSGVTTIIGNTVTTGFVNALNITAVNLNAATGTFSGSLTVGTALDTVVSNSFPSDVNLVGYWAFDEGTGSIAYDNSGNSNNATLVNTPTWITGVVGKGLTFASASSQYGTITALGNKFGSGTMTICFQ